MILAEAEVRSAFNVEWREEMGNHWHELENFAEALEQGVLHKENVAKKRLATLREAVECRMTTLISLEENEGSILDSRRRSSALSLAKGLEEEEAACEVHTAKVKGRSAVEMRRELLRRDRTFAQLSELRRALRQQHAAAEEAHASAMDEEERAERALRQRQA